MGSSGIVLSQTSSPALNWTTVPSSIFLRFKGIVLKSLEPLTDNDDALAFLTASGDLALYIRHVQKTPFFMDPHARLTKGGLFVKKMGSVQPQKPFFSIF